MRFLRSGPLLPVGLFKKIIHELQTEGQIELRTCEKREAYSAEKREYK